ncbi:SusD family protein [Algoriphagus locisalis]|uniref:SusD family protein n=1 Tax=Algoriphagus locisalis TaxID=305507 RepID=A0A1I6Y6J1_9BACT|nr:RagB/SusD family nutrient uptake outer membrane protein [Algoriphagus locisalis]SFT46108.1 SusD family protein [Algoriphagus locisalis]
MKKHTIILLLIGLAFLPACDGFFDEKPAKSLVVPQSLNDYQAILDALPRNMNTAPTAGLLASDDIVFGPSILGQLYYSQASIYLWREDFYLPDEDEFNWYTAYNKVFQANVVLDGLNDYDPESNAEAERKNYLTASARFYRGMGHFEVMAHFAETYDPANPGNLGIPIRLTSDVNQKIKRSSQQEGYASILSDFEFGLSVLPEKANVLTRPSKWAIHAMLSRIYLYIQDYEKSKMHALEALAIDDSLMDYQLLNSTLTYSFEVFNEEIIFYNSMPGERFSYDASTFVNPELVNLYDSSDFRLHYFFKPSQVDSLVNFRGNYSGDYFFFGGLAVDEVVLNYAESAARTGDTEDALMALNRLIFHRLDSAFYKPVAGLEGISLLKRIAEERRKELVFRGLRWLDLKRYNKDPEMAVTLRRNLNEENSTLSPNDPRYVLPIPPKEMSFNPLTQNPR